jgi:hypothetical protein
MSGGRPSNQESYFIDNINIFAYYRKGNQNIAAINLLHSNPSANYTFERLIIFCTRVEADPGFCLRGGRRFDPVYL